MVWNDRDGLAPRFRVICDVSWEELQPTEDEGVRACSRCQKAVFEARDEASFEQHASLGRCVFVTTSEQSELIAKPDAPSDPEWVPLAPLAGAPLPPMDIEALAGRPAPVAKAAASQMRGRLGKLALALPVLVLGLVALWWFRPGPVDRLVYGEVSAQCEGRLVLEGELEGESLAGRHCRVGQRLSQTESGFFVAFEYARDGQVLLWGRGAAPRDPGDTRELDVAMVRTPGDAGRWMCAGRGSWSVDRESGEHGLELHQLGLMLDEAELESSEGTLKVDEEQIVLEVGHWLATVAGTGRSCDQDLERCTFDGDERETIRALIRSEGEGEPGYAFVVRQNQRAARWVQLSVSADAKPTLNPMTSAQLRELSALVSCPLEEPGAGELLLRWGG